MEIAAVELLKQFALDNPAVKMSMRQRHALKLNLKNTIDNYDFKSVEQVVEAAPELSIGERLESIIRLGRF